MMAGALESTEFRENTVFDVYMNTKSGNFTSGSATCEITAFGDHSVK